MKRILSVFLPNLSNDLRRLNSSSVDEQEALVKFSNWAGKFSPLVAPDICPFPAYDSRFFGINLDITGCEKLFKGEKEIVKAFHRKLLAHSVQSRFAIAPSLGSAWALSRYSGRIFSHTDPARLKSSLFPLSIEALRILPKMAEDLRELQICTIKDLLTLSKPSLLSRFSKDLLQRIEQILGLKDEPIMPQHIQPPLCSQFVFDVPISDMQMIERALLSLLDKVLAVMEPAQKKISQLGLYLKTEDSGIVSRTVFLSVPSYDRKHLSFLLRNELEKITQVRSGITALSLSVLRSEFAVGVNSSHLPDEQGSGISYKQSSGALLDMLCSTLGYNRVLQLQTLASHVPEEAYKFVCAKDNFFSAQPSPILLDVERPNMLFDSPILITAMSVLPDYPPFWLKWKGSAYRIQLGVGPERISPEWWKDSLQSTRDYFKVQLPSGTWLWIFHELGTERWFVHGLWG